MLVIRPVTLADLSALEQLAEHAVPRLTNLPANRDRLEERIVRSQEAFESEIEYPGNEHYMFVLADDSRNEVLGTATIRAQAGAAEAYYTYRQETLIHASQQLNVRREVQTLALSHEASDATL
ncbi:MAG: arginine N-succinyltransferase, partial [Pseudomonadota bacterium]|nr:arginine N-succinyltransferase [Pseudomonadota bacterium]